MRPCPHCDAKNAKKNTFCWACGELIQVDPGFAKQFRHMQAEDRKNGRDKRYGAVMLVLAVFGFLGYEMTAKLVTTAFKKATPVIEAQVESTVQNSIKAELPTIAAQANQQVAARVRQELGDSVEQAAHQEAEKFKPSFQAHFAAIQAEEDTKLHAAYQEARTNFQQAQPSFQPTSLPALTTGNLGSSPLFGGGTAGMSLTDLLNEAKTGSTTLTVSVTSSPIQGSLGSTFCFTDKGTVGLLDSNGSCKEYPTQLSNVISTVQ
jgi:hypothetical protein